MASKVFPFSSFSFSSLFVLEDTLEQFTHSYKTLNS